MAREQSQLSDPASASGSSNITNPPPYPEDASSSEIKRDIEQTRSRMDRTLDELGDRLAPRHLLDDVLGLFRKPDDGRGGRGGRGRSAVASAAASAAGSIASTTGSVLWRTVKRHPLPSIVIVGGVAWLVYDSISAAANADGKSYRRGRKSKLRDPDLNEPGMYSGSIVDARTGRPYDESYGREARGFSGVGGGGARDYGTTATSAGVGGISAAASYGAAGAAGGGSSAAAGYQDYADDYEDAYDYADDDDFEDDYEDDIGGGAVTFASSPEADTGWACEWDEYSASDEYEDDDEYYDYRSSEERRASGGGKGFFAAAKRWAREVGRKMSQAYESVRDTTGEASHTAGDYARSAGRSVKSTAKSAARSVRRGVRGGYEGAVDYGSRAGRQIGRGVSTSRDAVGDAIQDYPLAAAGVAAALGLVVGLLVPRTRREDELMGEYAGDLKRRAKTAGREAVRRSKDLASTTAQSVVGEVQQEGLTPGGVVEKAGRILSEAGRAAADAAEREGLSPSQLKETAKNVAKRTKETAKEEAQRQADEVKRAATSS